MEQLGEFTRIYQVAGLRSPVFDPRYRFLLPHGYMVPYAGAIWKILKEEDPDLVEVCDKYALIWLAGLLRKRMLPGLKRPSLVGFSCERMDDNISAYLGNGEFGRRFARYYMGWCYIPFFDVHIVNSAYTADELQRAMVPKHRRPVWVCPMGVDRTSNAGASNGDARSELMQKIGAHPNSRLLFYAGRLSPEKNLELLLDTMDLLVDQGGDYHMILAGDGPRAEWLREKGLARLPGRVHCLGHVSNREELLLLYRSCDAFVHPNPREPFGIAPLEALAFGLPLVAPNSGGVLAYADETNAWLTDPDPAAFSTAILSVFMDPDSRERKVAAGLQTAAQHEWPAVTRELFGIYDKAAFSFKEKARA
jgi:glycosyltransferase involved in cell wall biosynthesis